MKNDRHSFSSSIGFVLAAAGSAVGLGNIWRFPYLAAKDGGGLFLVIYLILALTFGFSLLTSEIAIGRKTKQSPLTAYGTLKKGWGKLGIAACIVPMMIMPYYCVIGGWVLRYAVSYIAGDWTATAQDGYFTSFITSDIAPIVYGVIFLGATCLIIYRGVNRGIEAFSKVLMPILLVLIIGIAIFSLTLSNDSDGTVRTGLQGLKIFMIPRLEGLSASDFLVVIMDAMGQLFYSLSIAMGIMVAYGSYVKDDENLMRSINQIEIFDTGVAVLAGIMIIPAVFVFMGTDGMSASGPGLMFISIPKVFLAMGSFGRIIGVLFFLMVLFAALTSSMSILEAIVSSFMDQFSISRKKATVTEFFIALIFELLVCLGYNKLYFEFTLPNGVTAQILDIMDYVSNNILMPIVAISTCILIGWVIKPETIIEEVTKNGSGFGRKKLYVVMIKYIAPIMLLILFLQSFGFFNFLLG
ncbi:MAG: sodium-dependent transporter [Lachnospiraceae bacterium]|nr:sodium-dependent transporter [Lachnospiraceae bacterium]